jgi:hypothetical protein
MAWREVQQETEAVQKMHETAQSQKIGQVAKKV